MIGDFRRFLLGAFLVACLIPFARAVADGAPYAGRPVVEVLLELRDAGFDFIYSSELLPASLRVLAEPGSTHRLMIAREILLAHGLGLSIVRPGLYAVVPAARLPQDRYVRGRVVDVGTGRPVTLARIEVLPIGAIGWSDATGHFSVGPVPEGSYTVQAQAAGFLTLEMGGVPVAATSAIMELRLEPARAQLAEIVVSTSRYALDRTGAFGSVRIDGETIAAQPVLGEDAIRALGRLPGIAQSSLSAQSSIRGAETGEQLTLLDGFPLRQAFHIPGYQSIFGLLDPGLIDDAEIYTGGFPVRYGNRMGGVFDLRTIDATNEPATALGLSAFNAVARHGGTLDTLDADWLATARAGTLKPFIHAFAPDAGSPTYGDAYARIGYGEPELVRISANFLWSRDELSIVREGHGEKAQIESRNRYLWLRGDREWRNGMQSSLWLGRSSMSSSRVGTLDNRDIATGSVFDRRSSDYLELRGKLSWQANPSHWFEGGFEWNDEKAEYRYRADATYTDPVAALFMRDNLLSRAVELTPERERMALYAAHRWRIADEVISELGLRAQRTITAGTTTESWLYDPRFNLRWQIAPGTNLRAHWGRFHQTDEVHELKVEDGLQEFPEAQRSDHLIFGLDQRLQNGLALRVEWFRKQQSEPRPHFENLLDPLSLIPEIAPDRVMVAPAAAEIHGAELSLIAERPGVTWWMSLAWSEAFDLVEGRHVPRGWDQTWAATAGVDWTHGPWRFGAVAGSHRGWPTTRVRETALGERNAARFSTRGMLDLRAEYRKPLALGSLALTIELTNAVNVGNTCCSELIAVDDGNGGTLFTTRKSDWLPLVPSIGVLWEF